MKTLGIIPARYQSSRFPGKVLAKIHEKTILQRVHEQVLKAGLDEVVVATDHQSIFDHVGEFGGKVLMTDTTHATGTERCAAALNQMDQTFDIAINIQADEPFIDPSQIQLLGDAFQEDDSGIATLIQPISDPDDLYSPNVVKVVKNNNDKALLFSRTTIPYLRDVKLAQWISHHTFYAHLGIYAYRTEVLKSIINLPPSPLEQAESLEQLRWLENGYDIKVVESSGTGLSIDTPKDLEKARQIAR